MSSSPDAPGVGVDNTAILIMIAIAGVPLILVCCKVFMAPNKDDLAAVNKKGKKGRGKKVEDAYDDVNPVEWFAGKLSSVGQAALVVRLFTITAAPNCTSPLANYWCPKAAMGKDAEEKYAMSPNELWTIVDENGDGTLTMGEFKRVVQKNAALQTLLSFDHVPDVQVIKKLFRKMQSACSDGDGISKKDFMKFWDELDTDRSGKVSASEVDAKMN